MRGKWNAESFLRMNRDLNQAEANVRTSAAEIRYFFGALPSLCRLRQQNGESEAEKTLPGNIR
jgi:hypothetical protein